MPLCCDAHERGSCVAGCAGGAAAAEIALRITAGAGLDRPGDTSAPCTLQMPLWLFLTAQLLPGAHTCVSADAELQLPLGSW